MKLKFNSRKWHAWISFALSLPILLVAVTSILIGHGQKLGFREIKFYPSWLPGYEQASKPREGQRPNSDGANLARLIRDLHTGEAFLGRDNKWIWDDIVGGSMTFLALTGVYLWWNGQRKLFVAKRARTKLITPDPVS